MTIDAPDDEAAIAAIVADAGLRNETLKVSGRNSKADMLRPVRAHREISLRNHGGITLYSPGELVLSARAGTTIAEIDDTLKQHGQHLVAEPPDLTTLLGGTGNSSSLGGMVAANLSGPRRVAWGAMRDHILGVRLVNGAGEIIRSGGRVLKNVTGLDLCKLMAGSHGTLGVLTEITMKVMPAPQATGTLVLVGQDPTSAIGTMSAALGSPYAVSGAAWLPGEISAAIPALRQFGQSVTLIRIEDFKESVQYRVARLSADLDAAGGITLLDDLESHDAWRMVRDAAMLAPESNDAVWRISVRPSAGAAIVAALPVGARFFLDWGGGLVWVAASAENATHQLIMDKIRQVGGQWMLMRAPDAFRETVDVVPPEPDSLARLTHRVKQAMDPKMLFNPGRIYAGL